MAISALALAPLMIISVATLALAVPIASLQVVAESIRSAPELWITGYSIVSVFAGGVLALHALRNTFLRPSAKLLWLASLVLAAPLAAPLYWLARRSEAAS